MEQLIAVMKQIEQAFPEAEVYTEKIQATGKPPCFLVETSAYALQKELNRMYRLTEVFRISYYNAKRSIKECLKVNERLASCLKNVNGNWGKETSFLIKDGVLRVEYRYSYRVRLTESIATEKMKKIEMGMEMVSHG